MGKWCKNCHSTPFLCAPNPKIPGLESRVPKYYIEHKKTINQHHFPIHMQRSPCFREEKKRTRPPPKIFWGTFLASKKNFPDRWWIQNLMKTRKLRSTTEIFPLWPPQSSALEQGGVCFLFPSVTVVFAEGTCAECICHSAAALSWRPRTTYPQGPP